MKMLTSPSRASISRPREGPDPDGETHADTPSDGTRSPPDQPRREASLFDAAA
jgi:hypothetical protein